jgi:hypothetical protein
LRELRRQFPESGATERGGPFTPDAVNRLIKRIDTRAIQDWLGDRSIQHTVRYTELAPTRFKDFWRD